jgi:hypothetical protein
LKGLKRLLLFLVSFKQLDHLAVREQDSGWNKFWRKFKFRKSAFEKFGTEEKLEICRRATEVPDSKKYGIRLLEGSFVGAVKLYEVEHTSDEYWMSDHYEETYQLTAFSCPTDPPIYLGEGPIRVTTRKQVILVIYQESLVNMTIAPLRDTALY